MQMRDQSDESGWRDFATVTVPAKTKRKTVVAKALEETVLASGKVEFIRVIPAEHAVPIRVEMEQPPPQLKIGDR